MAYFPILKKDILLIGAGFTASVGGYVASEMWSKLFNHQDLFEFPNVKRLMRHGSYKFDYEKIYQEVVINKQKEFNVDKKTIQLESKADTALKKAMEDSLNDLVNKTGDHRQYCYFLNVFQLKALIKYFSGSVDESGAIFTTNQDLFLETLCRQGYNASKHMIQHPGFDQYLYSKDLLLPADEEELESRIGAQTFDSYPFLNYCKMHGSIKYKKSDVGGSIHITGINKPEMINKEPLLHWYFQLFEKALKRSGVRLLVIGYGFNDKHVNKLIEEAVKGYDLKLCIIDPRSPNTFYQEVVYPKGNLNTARQEIWNGVHMYLPYSLQKIFPPPTDPGRKTMINTSPAQDLDCLFRFTKCFNDDDVKFDLSI